MIRRAIPILLLLAAPPLMLYTLWINPLSAGEDDVGYYFPLRQLVGQSLARGQVPLWNPLEATGAPLMADPQAAVMHPTTWLFAALPAQTAYTLSIYMAFWLAGLGAYFYLRRLGLVPPAATFGALAFMFCGFTVGHRVHLGLILTAAMLPWMLAAIELLRDRPRGGLCLLAAAAALALVAGHWPTFIHMSIIAGAYFSFRARPLGRSLLLAAAAGLIAVAIAAPQLAATYEVIHQATRQKIGFAMAGENSFFPAASVLALFPLLMGSRTPGFFPQPWWGTWHLCEMLGYVGLITLALGGATVWRLFRKPRPSRPWPAGVEPTLQPLVRAWTFIAIGAGIWMLGYYLPTYALIYKLPVLGMVRCPARMVLAVDLALTTLAAIGIHAMIRSAQAGCHAEAYSRRPASAEHAGASQTSRRFSMAPAIRSAAVRVLPTAMIVALAALALAAAGMKAMGLWGKPNPFFIGSADDALAAIDFTNPAVYVPLALAAATAAAVLLWLRSPQRRTPVLIVLLLADLFFITRFVDVPRDVGPGDAQQSPAAAWLAANATESNYLVYGLSKNYFGRANELLLPKACCTLGVGTIANYGPIQSPAHAQLLGFGITGYNRDWESLLRRNYLLSLYNVRYILAEAGSEFDAVLRSVTVTAGRPEPIGPEMIGGNWKLDHAEMARRTSNGDDYVVLSTPVMWRESMASQPIGDLEPNAIYRIELSVRGPAGGAANFLRADIFRHTPKGDWWQEEKYGMTVPAEQIGDDCRRFRWTFATDANRPPSGLALRLMTLSERPIEVQAVSLRRMSQLDSPVAPGPLKPGDEVYPLAATLPPLHAGEAPIVIYRNLLARADVPTRPFTADEIERLKWSPPQETASLSAPQLTMSITQPARPLWLVSIAGLAALAASLLASIRRRQPSHT